MRTSDVAKIRELAEHATVPVINGLTDLSHPCQLMADVLTYEEHRGPIAGQVVAWCGDGNNVARSWIEAAVRFGFTLRLATPDALRPPADMIEWARAGGDDKHAELKEVKRYRLNPGQAGIYQDGAIHSIDYPDRARFIRVTGTNLDKIQRVRFDLNTGEVHQMTPQQAT